LLADASRTVVFGLCNRDGVDVAALHRRVRQQ
jgi:hypothetical protein